MAEDKAADRIHRLSLGDGAVRAQIVSLGPSWREVVSRHALPAAVLAELGHLTVAGILLATALKFDGKLILQVHGDGPVRLVVVESDAQGSFRATAKLASDETVEEHADFLSLVNRHGNGRFVVTLDPGAASQNRQPYQGIVSLEGSGVAAMLESYLSRSEQVPSRIWLAADGNTASGLLLQKMPDDGGESASADPQAWERLCLLADTLTRNEMLSLAPEQLLHRLFWQEPQRHSDQRICRFACSCTRQKVAAMLRMLGQPEVTDIIAERGNVEVNCDFCNQRYEFDAVDCAQLFASDLDGTGTSTARH